jgi:predicted RNA-binding Zn-ribbon protein involved in translation (DUF1610 family)
VIARTETIYLQAVNNMVEYGGTRCKTTKRHILLVLIMVICAIAAVTTVPVSANRTELNWGTTHGSGESGTAQTSNLTANRTEVDWGIRYGSGWFSIAEDFNLTAGSWLEVDIQAPSTSLSVFVVDNSDYNAHKSDSPLVFDHSYVNATAVAGSVTKFGQIPQSGEYWIVDIYTSASLTANASFQVWLLGEIPPGAITPPPLRNLPLSDIFIGVISLAFVMGAVLVVRRRRDKNERTLSESAAIPDKISALTGDSGWTMHGLTASSFGMCSVCNMELGSGGPFVRCPSCGSMAHRTHMLEWLHVHDYCPACGSHIDQRSIEEPP